MENKINTLFDYIKTLSESDLDRIIKFVLGIVFVNQQSESLPDCPYCGGSHVIKHGHKNKKQRFMCYDCKRTYMHTTNTLMANSHYTQSVWIDFIQDTLYGKTLDESAKKYGFSHQTSFNMRHKVLMALQDFFEKNPVLLSDIAELDETFVLDCYKGGPVPESAGREARKHGAKAAKRGISNEYISICTGVQRDGGVIAASVNRAKPSSKELEGIFRGHIAESTLVLTDGLRSYHVLETLADCTVVDINREEHHGFFNLNTVNSLHSFIKETYNHYRGVATKYINRYNALFSIAFRCASNLKDTLLSSLGTVGQECYWHSIKDVRNWQLLLI
mgnify:FL=1|jgi:transposase-like protein